MADFDMFSVVLTPVVEDERQLYHVTNGATTLTILTLSIATLSIVTFSITIKKTTNS